MIEVTHILSAIEQGDAYDAERFLPPVADELRRLAAQKLAEEKPGQIVQATDLAHEAKKMVLPCVEIALLRS
jgi:hypothetical protein